MSRYLLDLGQMLRGEGFHGENRDALEGVQCEQVGIARHDAIGIAIQGKCQELVIVRIAACPNGLGCVNTLALTS